MSEENIKSINIDKVTVMINTDTDEIYVSRCIECEKLLTADEASYGHDCE
jgi:hypothetical protein